MSGPLNEIVSINFLLTDLNSLAFSRTVFPKNRKLPARNRTPSPHKMKSSLLASRRFAVFLTLVGREP